MINKICLLSLEFVRESFWRFIFLLQSFSSPKNLGLSIPFVRVLIFFTFCLKITIFLFVGLDSEFKELAGDFPSSY